MADRKMRYTENKIDGRHENGVDGENGNKGFATWREIDDDFSTRSRALNEIVGI